MDMKVIIVTRSTSWKISFFLLCSVCIVKLISCLIICLLVQWGVQDFDMTLESSNLNCKFWVLLLHMQHSAAVCNLCSTSCLCFLLNLDLCKISHIFVQEKIPSWISSTNPQLTWMHLRLYLIFLWTISLCLSSKFSLNGFCNYDVQRADFLEKDDEMEIAHCVAASAGETEVNISQAITYLVCNISFPVPCEIHALPLPWIWS